ncbi:MAG: cytochrome c biogenesis protein CcsA, partial [Anaerolineales bacterium]|nr:cytochrome c biogenesis protein CcsA [Anaerolineales bacterium]
FGLLMGFASFLSATMLFAADPLAPSLAPPQDGAGLSPLLQHPAMLIHPPVVFLGYAVWAIPCAVTFEALTTNRLASNWLQEIRPWALAGWAILGAGIVLGARWAYTELGWGGYWAWDPVENGSLIPWLTATASLHGMMAWRFRGVLKKSTILLIVATFGMCLFSTFLTRSGIFSSLHAFSQSPIGWLFLGCVLLLAVSSAILLFLRRDELTPNCCLQ